MQMTLDLNNNQPKEQYKCLQQSSSYRIAKTGISTWTLSLTSPSTILHLRIRQSRLLLNTFTKPMNIRLRLFQRKHQTRKDDVFNTVGYEWESAQSIAKNAGVPHRCAVKILMNYAILEKLETKIIEWTDSKFRTRKCRLYKKPRQSQSEVGKLLNMCLGIAPVHVDPPAWAIKRNVLRG